MGRALKLAPGSRLFTPRDLENSKSALLLDTHIWIWFLEGDTSRIHPAAVQLLERCGGEGNLVVSDISFWEVATKAAKGKLTLSVDATIWLDRARLAPGVRCLPLDRETLILSTRLAGTAHNDPADRMLLAIAQLNNVPLVTTDALIIDYARSHAGTPVVDVRR